MEEKMYIPLVLSDEDSWRVVNHPTNLATAKAKIKNTEQDVAMIVEVIVNDGLSMSANVIDYSK